MSEVEGETELQVRPLSSSWGGIEWSVDVTRVPRSGGGGEDICHCDSWGVQWSMAVTRLPRTRG